MKINSILLEEIESETFKKHKEFLRINDKLDKDEFMELIDIIEQKARHFRIRMNVNDEFADQLKEWDLFDDKNRITKKSYDYLKWLVKDNYSPQMERKFLSDDKYERQQKVYNSDIKAFLDDLTPEELRVFKEFHEIYSRDYDRTYVGDMPDRFIPMLTKLGIVDDERVTDFGKKILDDYSGYEVEKDDDSIDAKADYTKRLRDIISLLNARFLDAEDSERYRDED